MGGDNLPASMPRSRARAARKYAVRAVVFQEGEWLCAQCLEYDLVAQAKSLQQLSRALQGAPAAHRRARSRPAPPQAAALPRSAPRTGEVLGDVQTVPTEAPRADVQARRTEVARRRSRTAPGSRRSSKRRLVLDSSLLPDAYSGGIHHARQDVRLYETRHPHFRVRGAHRLSSAWSRRLREARGPAPDP